jgi:hypothetical protein
VKVFGLISWYQESGVWLAAAVASAAKVCDHIVAVDGRYALYPNGRAYSSGEQSAIIQEVATSNGMDCTVHTPTSPWENNEIEKRAFMFRLAESLSTSTKDWYFIIDADVVVDQVPEDFRDRLDATDFHCAEVKMWEPDDVYTTPAKAKAAQSMDWPTNEFRCRCIYRALPGLTVTRNHYTYVLPDGRALWSNDGKQADALDLTDLRCEHRTNFRELSRRNTQRDYYQRRDAAGVEMDPCRFCKQPGVHLIPFDWQEDKASDALIAPNISVCDQCLAHAKAESDAQIIALGRDPSGVEYQGPSQ